MLETRSLFIVVALLLSLSVWCSHGSTRSLGTGTCSFCTVDDCSVGCSACSSGQWDCFEGVSCCSGHGSCYRLGCRCQEGYFGFACDVPARSISWTQASDCSLDFCNSTAVMKQAEDNSADFIILAVNTQQNNSLFTVSLGYGRDNEGSSSLQQKILGVASVKVTDIQFYYNNSMFPAAEDGIIGRITADDDLNLITTTTKSPGCVEVEIRADGNIAAMNEEIGLNFKCCFSSDPWETNSSVIMLTRSPNLLAAGYTVATRIEVLAGGRAEYNSPSFVARGIKTVFDHPYLSEELLVSFHAAGGPSSYVNFPVLDFDPSASYEFSSIRREFLYAIDSSKKHPFFPQAMNVSSFQGNLQWTRMHDNNTKYHVKGPYVIRLGYGSPYSLPEVTLLQNTNTGTHLQSSYVWWLLLGSAFIQIVTPIL